MADQLAPGTVGIERHHVGRTTSSDLVHLAGVQVARVDHERDARGVGQDPGPSSTGTGIRSLNPTGSDHRKWMIRWKAALNASANAFEGRIIPTADQ